jgi:1,4-alpha-glucan branching enzyme
MPTPGVWRELLNTDDLVYGGSGVSNQSFAVDTDTDLYIELRIPPLATVWFERV